MKKELVLQSVQNSVSSIFSKEDVINLINSVEEGSSRKITTDDIERAIDRTISWIENNSDRIIDEDSAEFELDYNNRITLSHVSLDVEEIREALENNFSDFANEEEFVQITDEFGNEEDIVELERAENEL
jgi:hypothetical protein